MDDQWCKANPAPWLSRRLSLATRKGHQRGGQCSVTNGWRHTDTHIVGGCSAWVGAWGRIKWNFRMLYGNSLPLSLTLVQIGLQFSSALMFVQVNAGLPHRCHLMGVVVTRSYNNSQGFDHSIRKRIVSYSHSFLPYSLKIQYFFYFSKTFSAERMSVLQIH